MNLPTDLKDYRAPDDDAFTIISPDMCVIIFCAALVLGYVLGING